PPSAMMRAPAIRAPVTGRWPAVGAAKLAMVPGGAAQLDELEPHALARLPVHHRRDLVVQLERGGLARWRCVAPEDLLSERRHGLELAVDDHVALEHHAPELLVLLARLDLQGRPRRALEVAHLLRGRIRPRPQPL